MMNIPLVWIAFTVGLFLGTAAGIFFLGLLVMARNNDEEGEIMVRNQEPREEMYHKYPVLIIPTDQGTDLVIGMAKARATIRYYRHIVAFVEKHTEIDDGSPIVMPMNPDPASR